MELVNYTRVLCFAPVQAIQGLQWYLDRHEFSARRFRLFPGRLADPNEDLSDFEIVWFSFDLGQPVPVEHLKNFRGHVGLASFQQPTPQQLLALGEASGFRPITWDGVSFERIALSLDAIAAASEKTKKESLLVDSLAGWLSQRRRQPGRLRLLNPPEGFPGAVDFSLVDVGTSLRIGGWRSRAPIRLPYDTGHEFLELNLREGAWTGAVLSPDPPVQGPPASRPIEVGDQISIGAWILQFAPLPVVEELASLMARSGMSSKDATLAASAPAQNLADFVRGLLLAGASGEIRVQSGLKHAVLTVLEGRLVHAVTGAVGGEKALFRVLAWPEAKWRFLPRDEHGFKDREMDFGALEFARAYADWIRRWEVVRSFVPSSQMRLEGNPNAVRQRSQWTHRLFLVLAAVSEFHLVRDVFNNCPLLDIDIVESLVELRKSGLILVQREFEARG